MRCENQYARAVRRGETRLHRSWWRECFALSIANGAASETFARSGLGLANDYADFDAETRFGLSDYTAAGRFGMHQRTDHAGRQEARRMFRVWQAAARPIIL